MNAKFGKTRFPQSYQTGVGMKSRKILHDNSKELADILDSHGLLKPGAKIFELGSGPCRNLYYIWVKQNNLSLYCNDLFREASYAEMHPDIRDKINFFEMDSEDMVVNNPIKDVDVFLSSDHFMHLEKEKAEKIITTVLKVWQPKNILLREVKKEFETPAHPRLYHNYDKFYESYDLTLEKTSNSSIDDKTNAYFIRLLRRR